MRIAGLLMYCCAALLASGCSSQDAATPPAPAATTATNVALEPKIVLQLGHAHPVIAVRWINGYRNLLSLGEDGAIMIWDTQTGAIVDQARIPVNGDPVDPKYLWFQDIRAEAGGNRL